MATTGAGRWRVVCATLALLVLAGPAVAGQPAPLGVQGARLLLTRTGFAPSAQEVARWAGLSQADAVDRLLAQAATVARTPAPAWVDEALIRRGDLRAMDEDARRRERRKQIRYGLELRGWWLQEMASTPSPLTERMTLFWHNHFVSALPKVRYAQLMYRQNVLLRRHALGDFRTLLHAIARDPAMLIYLDGASNRRDAPNENFARELMELFTLGEGHYGEADVKEAARSFSGWGLDLDRTGFRFRARLHDDGAKTVFGRTGPWNGDDVLDILLAQPATAEFLVRKLWREFVSPEPDPARVPPIAERFRSSDYDVRAALRELFLQPEMVRRDDDNALVKSPVELAIGLLRQADGELAHPALLALRLAGMGQNLFAPPNVRGWPGGNAWITTHSLLARKQFLEMSLAANRSPSGDVGRAKPAPGSQGEREPEPAAISPALARLSPVRIDIAAWLDAGGLVAERAVGARGAAALARELLVLAPSGGIAADALAGDALRLVLLDPAYQLK